MDAQKHKRILKKTGRITAWTLGSLIVVPISLVALVFVALTIRPIRKFAVEKGVAYANGGVMGGYTVSVESVDRLDPWGINVRGIKLFDDKKREMVSVKWVLARLKPLALIHNRLRLTKVEIDDVHYHLYPTDPNEPPKPEEPEQEDSGPSTFVVQAEHARIRSAEAILEVADRTLTAVVGTLAVGGAYGPKPALAIKEAQVRVNEGDELLLRMHTTEGKWTAEDGGRIGLEALVVHAPLSLEADLPPLDQMEPWPIKSAQLHLQDVDRYTVKVAGVEDGAGLNTSVSLSLDAKADGQKLSARLRVQTHQHSMLTLDASADDKVYDVALSVLPTQLKAVASLLPDLKVQGNVRVHATHGEDRMPKLIDLGWNSVAIDDGSAPGGAIKSELALPIVRIDSVKLTGLENAFALQAEYDTKHERGNGALQFHELDVGAIQAAQKLGLAGLLDGGLKANVTTKKVAADGRITVRKFKYPSVQFDALDLALTVSGTLDEPVGHFNLGMDRIAASDVKIDKLTADALATPRTLSGKFTVVGPDTNMKLELGGQRGHDKSLRLQGIGRGVVAKKELRFDLRELRYHHRALSVQELALYNGKQSVVVQGSLDEKQHVDAQLALANIDLASWASLLNMAGLEGMISGKATVQGTTSEPRVEANVNVSELKYKSDSPIDGTIAVKGDLGTRKAELKVGLYSTDELGARIEASAQAPKKPADLSKALANAKVKATASIFMPVIQISALAGDQLAGLDGMLDAKLNAEGTLDNPKVDLKVAARLKLPETSGNPVEAFTLDANVDKDQAKLSAWAQDEIGQLLSVDGQVAWPGGNPRAALKQPDAWRRSKFELAAQLTPRRLDTMQGVFAYFTKIYAMNLPLSAGGRVDFKGNDGQLGGTAKLRATIYGDKLDGHCRLGTTSALDLDMKLEQDRVDAKLGAKTDGGGSIQADISSHLALNALSGEEPVIGPAKATVEGKNIQIYKLPGLCNLAGGDASFKAELSGLGKDKPKVDVTAKVKQLSAPMTESMNVDIQAHATDKQATVAVGMEAKSRHVGSIDGAVPLTYAKGSTMPTVAPDAPVKAHVQFDKLLLANVLSFTEAFGRVGGSASADINVTGKLNDPYPAGFVQLNDVNMTIASLAQPLRQVNARLDIKGRSVKLEKLTAHDHDGKISVEGFATLNEDMSGNGGLYLEADRFPLRQQGTIIGDLTIRARADAKIPQNLKAEAQLKILDGRLWLTGDRGKDVQNLDAHPDIHFIDEKTEAETEAEAQKTGHPGIVMSSFSIKTEQDLWLEHQDFSLQVGVDVKLTQDDSGPKMSGQATLDRGELKLMGKSFKLKNGSIKFTGDMPPDPQLDIKATYTPPSMQDLVVSVSGRASSPQLEFSGAATSLDGALAILTGRSAVASGGSAPQQGGGDAASQMASIASNLTAGLLVMSARRRFGDWVPMVSINTGTSGEPTGASAGFDASKLIPSWAKGVAKSAYVEGMIGSQQQGGGGSVGLGVKLEVALPKSLVTDLGYGPGASWSTDVAWAP